MGLRNYLGRLFKRKSEPSLNGQLLYGRVTGTSKSHTQVRLDRTYMFIVKGDGKYKLSEISFPTDEIAIFLDDSGRAAFPRKYLFDFVRNNLPVKKKEIKPSNLEDTVDSSVPGENVESLASGEVGDADIMDLLNSSEGLDNDSDDD